MTQGNEWTTVGALLARIGAITLSVWVLILAIGAAVSAAWP